jgi:acyl dehydratase
MSLLKFGDIEIGEKKRSPRGKTVPESEVYLAAGMQGRSGDLHTNEHKMQQTEYGERLVQGHLLMLYMQGFSMDVFPTDSIAMYGLENVRFTEPVYIGDTVYMTVEVVDKEVRDEDSGIVTLEEQLFNQDDELVITRERLKLIRR